MTRIILTVFVIGMLSAMYAAPCIAGAGEVTDDTFYEEVLLADEPVVVEFWRENCAPCRRMTRVVEDLADEYTGRVRVFRMDTDSNDEMISLYEIEAVPTVIYFRGGYEAARETGAMSKAELKKRLGLP